MRPVKRFYNFYLSPEKDLARKLKNVIGFTPARISLFKQAFSHKSIQESAPEGSQSNERLEYLGDAILSSVVAEYLFKKYPNRNEGFLTKMRSKIVKRKSLNLIADKMGLDVILASYSQGRLSSSMLGNALEALLGAIYIEFGYVRTRNYIIKNILRKYLNIHELENFDDNYKSILLEWCQKNGKEVDYKLLSKFKSDKRDRFRVAVVIDGEVVSQSEDFNKKSAEQSASGKAINQLRIEHASEESVPLS